MNKEWGKFLTALEAKGVAFSQIQFASDRQTVIRATGFTDPLSVAIIETEWQRQQQQQRGPQRSVSSGEAAQVPGSVVVSTRTSASVRESNGGTRHGTQAPLNVNDPELDAMHAQRGDQGPSVRFPPLDDFQLLSTLPDEVQDVVVANELLAAALGFGGGLIYYQAPTGGNSTGGGFVVSSYVPLSMRGLCQTVLPVADAFVAVRKVEEAEYLGRCLVGMALGEIVSEIVTSYAHQVTKLQRWCEEKSLPLMGVVSEILRIGHHMVRLREVLPMDLLLTDTRGAGGGGEPTYSGGLRGPRILNHLTEQAERCAGSREDSELVQLLLRRALVPYLRMLHRWMHEGVLEDPFGEFFITEAHPPARPAPTALTNARRQNVSQLFPEANLAPGTDVTHPFDGTSRDTAAAAAVGIAAVSGQSTVDVRTLPPLTRDQQLAQQQQDVASFERRFSMNRLMIPTFLEKPGRVAKMIFFAGKYCCLLREYNDIRPVFGDAAEGMLVWSGADALHRRVQESFDITSQAVIQLLFSSAVDLMGHLQSLKNYFLHERGDWVVDFLDNAEELLRGATTPDRVRAHPLLVVLQTAIARSCGSSDPYHALIGCSLSQDSLAEHLARLASSREGSTRPSTVGAASFRESGGPCLEYVQLDVELQWPLTLVLDASVMARFNSIFRLLTWVKSCERRLASLWYTNEVLPEFTIAYSMKHQLTHFLRQFQFYAGHFVLEPLWSRLLSKIGQADSVFAISTALRDFFEHVEAGLVLSSPHRFRSLAAMLSLTNRFCDVGAHSSSPTTMKLVEDTLLSMHEEMLLALSELASPVGEDYAQLVPLLTWIDFSGFYEHNNVYHVQRGGAGR